MKTVDAEGEVCKHMAFTTNGAAKVWCTACKAPALWDSSVKRFVVHPTACALNSGGGCDC